jgi:hypothetical protein
VPCSQQAKQETYTGSDADGLPWVFLHIDFGGHDSLLTTLGSGFLGLLQRFAGLQ